MCVEGKFGCFGGIWGFSVVVGRLCLDVWIPKFCVGEDRYCILGLLTCSLILIILIPISTCFARYPPPASTKTPMRTLFAQLRMVPRRRWIQACCEHRASRPVLFLIRRGDVCVVRLEDLLVRDGVLVPRSCLCRQSANPLTQSDPVFVTMFATLIIIGSIRNE